MADDAPEHSQETVESLSALYLGNVLYALERCAIALEEERKPADAGFYRAIARKLAEARGREKGGRDHRA
jgi:hypothetical protein